MASKVLETVKDVAQHVSHGMQRRRKTITARIKDIHLPRPIKERKADLQSSQEAVTSLNATVGVLLSDAKAQMRRQADLLVGMGWSALTVSQRVKKAEEELEELDDEATLDEEEIAQDHLKETHNALAWANIIQDAYREAYLCLTDVYGYDSKGEAQAFAVKYKIYLEALTARLEYAKAHPEDQSEWMLQAINGWHIRVASDPLILTRKEPLFI